MKYCFVIIRLSILFLSLLFVNLHAQNFHVDINNAAEQLPKLTIKRGEMFRMEVEDTQTYNTIEQNDVQRYDLCLLHRNYNIDYTGSPTNFCNSPSEFYLENGEVKIRNDENFANLRRYADSRGLIIFQQMNRVPLEGTINLYPFRQGFYRDGLVSEGLSDFLLPIANVYDDYINKVVEYIVSSDEAAGVNSVWTLHDEPAHTLGFPINSVNNQTRAENTIEAARVSADVSKQLKTLGIKFGGIQLNGANATQIHNGVTMYSLATKEIKNRGGHLDYFTIQNYQGSFRNEQIINSARAALSDPYFADTKVFFNRYGYWQNADVDPNNIRDTSAEMIGFLKGEKVIVDNADIMYGYAIEARQFTDNTGKMLAELGMFLQLMPEDRKVINYDASGIDGFASSDTNKIMALIWNESINSKFDFKIKFSNIPTNWREIEIKKGSGTNLTNLENLIFDETNSSINIGTLEANSFLAITLSGSILNAKEYLVNDFELYPNPANSKFYLKNIDSESTSIVVYSLYGKELLSLENVKNDESIDVGFLSSGLYMIKISSNNKTSVKRLIKK